MSNNSGHLPEETWFEVAKDKLSMRFKTFLRRHKWKFTGVFVLVLAALFLLRSVIQPFFLLLREYSFVGAAVICFLVFFYFSLSRLRPLKVIIVSLVFIFSLTVYVMTDAQQYITSYLLYKSLSIVRLSTLPVTTNERIQPIDSIYVQASEKINETESVSIPDLILVDGEQKWSLEIYPTYLGQKIIKGHIGEIFIISATTATPDFSKREKVSFDTGENLLFSKGARTNAIKSLNFFNYFNMFPADVKFIPDEDGKWLQVISLVKYSGFFFPHLEFAGIHIIKQQPDRKFSIARTMKRISLGLGDFINAKELSRYKFLQNQNLIPYICTTKVAETFKFQRGFFSPIRTYHEGDIRIPKMLGNNTEMPYVLLFDGVKDREGLFHYFGLEPYDEHKHGLSLSLFIPSDGIDHHVYIYDHSKKQESLTGASAIATKVMESKKNYDWSTNQPVENRPFIKDIKGERRLFWLTTIATVNDEGGLAGSLPEIVVTDAATNLPVWVDSKNQSSWLEEIEQQLSHLSQN
jgi:hypothetical protein